MKEAKSFQPKKRRVAFPLERADLLVTGQSAIFETLCFEKKAHSSSINTTITLTHLRPSSFPFRRSLPPSYPVSVSASSYFPSPRYPYGSPTRKQSPQNPNGRSHPASRILLPHSRSRTRLPCASHGSLAASHTTPAHLSRSRLSALSVSSALSVPLPATIVLSGFLALILGLACIVDDSATPLTKP